GREVGHAELTAGARQLSEYVEVGQREPGRLRQVELEAAHEGGVCAQKRIPSPEPGSVRQLARREPIEQISRSAFRRYLHVQPSDRYSACSCKYIGSSVEEGKSMSTTHAPDRYT